MSTLLFAYGFEDFTPESELKDVFDEYVTTVSTDVISVSFAPTGSIALRDRFRYTNYSSFPNDRGGYVNVDTAEPEIWVGFTGAFDDPIATTEFVRLLVIWINGSPAIEVSVSGDGLAHVASNPSIDRVDPAGGALPTTTPDWSSSIPYGYSDDVNDMKEWVVNISRTDTGGSVGFYLADTEIARSSDIPALALTGGDMTQVQFCSRSSSTASSTDLWYVDDLWIATVNYEAVRVPLADVAAEGHYVDGTNADPVGAMNAYWKSDFIQLQSGEKRTFTFDTTGQLATYGVTNIGALDLKAQITSPSTVKFFCRVGGIDYDIATRTNNSGAPRFVHATSIENPATNLPWTRDDLLTAEFGIENVGV